MELKDEVLPGHFVAESSVYIANTGSSKQIQTTYTVTNKCLTAKETLHLIHRSRYEPQTFGFYSFITTGQSFIKDDKLQLSARNLLQTIHIDKNFHTNFETF